VKQLVPEILSTRKLLDGGLADRPGGQFRADATAWAIVCLRASGEPTDSLENDRAKLRMEQLDDGRVSSSKNHPNSYWPTPLAVLAWQNSQTCRIAQERAIQFLLSSAGDHPTRKATDPWAHDTALKGWPWVEGTHSWVEPTALCLMALRVAGYGGHARASEALRMILDRQLPHGGWNSGNTLIFGRELHPNPEGTGSALCALVGEVDRKKIIKSLNYLKDEVDRLRTPISLGWTLLALAAWDEFPSRGGLLVERCLANRSRYGDYDTSALCLLLLGGLAGKDEGKTNLFSPFGAAPAPGVLHH
jgi:hypothetical protein